MEEYLNHRVIIHTKDNSKIEGNLMAYDKTGNILLDFTFERYKNTPQRYLGLILFRGAHVNGVECLFKLPKVQRKKLNNEES